MERKRDRREKDGGLTSRREPSGEGMISEFPGLGKTPLSMSLEFGGEGKSCQMAKIFA